MKSYYYIFMASLLATFLVTSTITLQPFHKVGAADGPIQNCDSIGGDGASGGNGAQAGSSNGASSGLGGSGGDAGEGGDGATNGNGGNGGNGGPGGQTGDGGSGGITAGGHGGEGGRGGDAQTTCVMVVKTISIAPVINAPESAFVPRN